MKAEYISLFGSLAGILIPIGIRGIESRTKSVKQNTTLRKTKERLEFLTEWYKAQQIISSENELESLKKDLSEELHRLRNIVNHTFCESIKEATTHKKIFLTYTPHGFKAKIYQGFFYSIVGICFLGMLGLFINENNEFSFSYFLTQINSEFLIGLVTLIIFALMLRTLAIRAEKRTIESRKK